MIDCVYGVNIAVFDIAEATARFEALLGIQASPMKDDDFAFPGLRGSRFDLGGVFIHLITSLEPETSIAKFLGSRGEGVFLVSLRTSDLDSVMTSLEDKGIKPLVDPPADSTYGRVTFVHPKQFNGVQLELLETK